MANKWPSILQPRLHCSSKSFLFLSTLLLAFQPSRAYAQLQHPPSLAPSTSATNNIPTDLANPTNADNILAPSSAVPSAVPSATDKANYSSQNTEDKVILNYYFLLLAVFIIILIIAYWSIARRRRNRRLMLRNNQQSALERDVETWPGRRAGAGARWRHPGVDSTVEEGLDERGEAPPPYLKEPEAAHLYGREGVELQHMPAQEGKPPDYDAGPSSR